MGCFRVAKNYRPIGLNQSFQRKRLIIKRIGRKFSALLVQSVYASCKSKIRLNLGPRGHHDWPVMPILPELPRRSSQRRVCFSRGSHENISARWGPSSWNGVSRNLYPKGGLISSEALSGMQRGLISTALLVHQCRAQRADVSSSSVRPRKDETQFRALTPCLRRDSAYLSTSMANPITVSITLSVGLDRHST